MKIVTFLIIGFFLFSTFRVELNAIICHYTPPPKPWTPPKPIPNPEG